MINFYSIFIFSRDRRLMVGESYQKPDSIPQDLISTGVFETTKQYLKELQSKKNGVIELQKENEKICYYIKQFGDISVSIASDIIDNSAKLAQVIGWKFLRKYSDVDLIGWEGNPKLFEDFKSVIREAVSSNTNIDYLIGQESTQILTPIVVFELPDKLQNVAISMLSLEKATISDISEDLDIDDETSKQYLEQLIEMGYLHRTKIGNNTGYSIKKI